MTEDDLRGQVDELRASRARIVAAADDERRRVERELHDGVQQHLVALAVNLQLVRQLADSDLDAMRALLDQLAGDIRSALESVRALAQTVYPPLLLDRGLAEALRAAARKEGASAQLDVAAAERYPPEVEAAVYFGCIEALANGAAVRVWAADGSLWFEVAGDAAALTGASTVADRAGALGGTIEAEPGRITGRIPVER
jgi:signal transduction histidine kinase